MECFLMLVLLCYFLNVDWFLDMYIMVYTYAHVIEWNKKLRTCLHVQQDKHNSRLSSGIFCFYLPYKYSVYCLALCILLIGAGFCG